MRYVALLLAGTAVLLAACGDDGAQVAERSGTPVFVPLVTPEPFPNNTPDNRTPYPGVAPGIRSFDGQEPLPPLPEGAAVYLSLGGSINWGCCDDPELSSHPRFAHYLSETLNRQVVWVSLAGNGTLRGFLNGELGGRPQLDAAEEAIQELRQEGHDIVAIMLSIGGNDLLALRNQGCTGGGQPECTDAFTKLITEEIPFGLKEVYDRLSVVKDEATPILHNNLYDTVDCGQEGAAITTSAVSVGLLNDATESGAKAGGGFTVDFETAFKGHACEYISGVDPTYLGYDVILDLDIEAYEALPDEYVEPWKR